ncbi:HAD-IA family hydrolase [Dactylosporangium vinaceum]|nr:HAD-IA family hydrolase [Dactylosporangium vinaceum]
MPAGCCSGPSAGAGIRGTTSNALCCATVRASRRSRTPSPPGSGSWTSRPPRRPQRLSPGDAGRARRQAVGRAARRVGRAGTRAARRGFAISEVLGCNKPDPRMYAEGRRLLDLPAGDCLFIDDDPALVAAARELGYQGLTLDRTAAAAGEGVITSLEAIAP